MVSKSTGNSKKAFKLKKIGVVSRIEFGCVAQMYQNMHKFTLKSHEGVLGLGGMNRGGGMNWGWGGEYKSGFTVIFLYIA